MLRVVCRILLMSCLLLPFAAMAQGAGGASFELRQDADGSYRLVFRMGEVAFSQGQDGWGSSFH